MSNPTNHRTAGLLLLFAPAFICMPHPAIAATSPTVVYADRDHSQPAAWKSLSVQHAYGLPSTKPKEKGTLNVTPDGLTFAGKSGGFSIPHDSIIAVNAGNQRVELWGMKGRLLRMVIPNGGGIAAAGFMHHRVDMLTVEFSDSTGGYHGAVFLLPANEAEHALQSFAQMRAVNREIQNSACTASSIQPRSVLVSVPTWDQIQVPAVYRALVYEHLIDRLQRLEGVGHVYRDGENSGPLGCPQYTVHISIAGFRQGSQVTRAVMGPVGMFVGTTQMRFEVTITDASGRLNTRQQVKATVRGESENTNVAESIAKTIAKRYSSAMKGFEKSSEAGSTKADRRR